MIQSRLFAGEIGGSHSFESSEDNGAVVIGGGEMEKALTVAFRAL